ncbi:MAG: PAS domain S-box protein, partial [Spirochaetales bacterium]|nr:PAS domain S-box protein [Spirochaetales bacterium]
MEQIIKRTVSSLKDEEQLRMRKVLLIVLAAIAAGGLVLSVVAFLYERWLTLLATIGVFVLSSFSLFMARKGYFHFAQTLTMTAILAASVYNTYIGRGIHDIAVAVFPVAIVLASIMLSMALYVGFTTISILAVSAIGFLKWEGETRGFFRSEDFGELFVLAVIFTVTAVASRLLVRNSLLGSARAIRSEEKYCRIYEHVQDMYYETNFDGLLLETNLAGEKLLRGTRKEIIGKPVARYYADPSVRESILSYLEREGSITNYEFQLRDLGGNIHLVSLNASILENQKEKERRIIGSMRDITEHKFVEEQLLQAQKMESIGALTGGIAHDFNNLLTVINGQCEMALLDIGDSETDSEIEESIHAIRAAGKRAADLTGQLLAFSRKQAFEPQAIAINRLIRNLRQIMRTLAGERITLDLHLNPVPNILADPSQVEQIIV